MSGPVKWAMFVLLGGVVFFAFGALGIEVGAYLGFEQTPDHKFGAAMTGVMSGGVLVLFAGIFSIESKSPRAKYITPAPPRKPSDLEAK